MDGFLAGVNYYNEETGEDVQLLGWDGSDGQFTENFTNLDDGRRITESLLDNGADTILPVAGPVGGGSAAAIQDRGEGRLIWVDTDGYESTDFGDIMFTSIMKQHGRRGLRRHRGRSSTAPSRAATTSAPSRTTGVGARAVPRLRGRGPGRGQVDALDEIRQGIIAGEIEVAPNA